MNALAWMFQIGLIALVWSLELLTVLVIYKIAKGGRI